MFKFAINQLYSKGNVSEEIKLIYIYRYLSWILTSAFYMIGQPYSPIRFKLGVIVSLLILSKVITDLYVKNITNSKTIKILLLIETSGISLLLIPTGGLHSPFIWYALNSVLVAASFLDKYYCWINLMFYLLFSTTISYFNFNSNRVNIFEIIINKTEHILIFSLITLVVQLLSFQTIKLRIESRKLLKTNNDLIEANKKIKEYMERSISLYQALEAFTTYHDRDKLIEAFINYTKKLTKASVCFFWVAPYGEEEGKIKLIFEGHMDIESQINTKLEMLFTNRDNKDYETFHINENKFLIMRVQSNFMRHGIIGINIERKDNEMVKQLKFLSELLSIILEKLSLERINDQLIIVEEQNRIANEMHDNVSQRLFSISCAIHVLMKKWNTISELQLKNQLINIQESSKIAIEELRSTIYKLSSKKKGEKVFELDIRNFLNDISKLNGIQIDVNISGNEDYLSTSLKKALFRIISEATGNSIRHGKCNKIDVKLSIEKSQTKLLIIDNGKGFIVSKENVAENTGLGLNNISILVETFGGKLNINSLLGKGTEIEVIIDKRKVVEIQKGGVAI